MLASTSFALLAFALQARAQFDDWAFGNMFTTNEASKGYITRASWSVTPPPVPTDSKGDADGFMSIWIGVSTSLADQSAPLVQPLLNWAPDQSTQGCPAGSDEWCVAASTFTGSVQVAEPYKRVKNGEKIDFEITCNGKKSTHQTVSIGGEVISEQDDSVNANPTIFFSSNECYKNNCGSLTGYSWDNITIELSQADKGFATDLQLTGASGKLTTSDNGKTWSGSIKINADKFPK